MTQPAFEDLRQGDFVKVRVGNERLWFEVLHSAESQGMRNAVVCRLASAPAEGVVFDGRVTIDRDWITDTARQHKPTLKVVA
jgi:hypothetical protein